MPTGARFLRNISVPRISPDESHNHRAGRQNPERHQDYCNLSRRILLFSNGITNFLTEVVYVCVVCRVTCKRFVWLIWLMFGCCYLFGCVCLQARINRLAGTRFGHVLATVCFMLGWFEFSKWQICLTGKCGAQSSCKWKTCSRTVDSKLDYEKQSCGY